MGDTQKQFEEWAIVEVMGHSRYAGLVSEASIGGTSFVRIDVPAVKGRRDTDAEIDAFTKYLGGGSIFSITPCTEITARAAAAQFAVRPIDLWGIEKEIDRQRALPAPAVTAGGPEVDDYSPMPF